MHRAITQGFWWLNMQQEVADYVRRCDRCQMNALLLHKLRGSLNLIASHWPFAQWGLDRVGPFLRASGNRWYVVVVTKCITKWVEAEALMNIRDMDIKRFVWKNIVTRFKVPQVLVFDNGLQFDSKLF